MCHPNKAIVLLPFDVSRTHHDDPRPERTGQSVTKVGNLNRQSLDDFDDLAQGRVFHEAALGEKCPPLGFTHAPDPIALQIPRELEFGIRKHIFTWI